MKSLVVDAELISRKKMIKTLAAFGQCDDVKNGNASISAVKASLEDWKLYNLITLEISLPDISGIEILSIIKKLEEARGLDTEEKAKILIVTSHSDKETVKACVGKCDGYMIKPVNKDVMVEKIKKMALLS